MIVRLATSAMGTRFEFVLSGDSEGHLRAVGEAAIEEVLLWHARLSAFASDSLVSHINRTAYLTPVRVDEDVWNLLNLCERVWRESDGAFDPTVGGSMRLAGFHPGGDGIAAGWGESVSLDAGSRYVRFLRAGVLLDLGAVAKGFALDRAAAIVREHGIRSALLHGGTSSVMAIGRPPESDGWRIAIRSEGAPITVVLKDQAMSVSAPRGREVDGRGHILDPRTGESGRLVDTAVVVCDRGDVADAWSTALVVDGARPAGMPEELGSLVHSERGWDVQGVGVGDGFIREVA